MIAVDAATINGSEIRDRIEDAGCRAPQRRLLQPDHPERNPRRYSHNDAGDDTDEEELGDLMVDVVEDLNGDLLFPGTARPASRVSA